MLDVCDETDQIDQIDQIAAQARETYRQTAVRLAESNEPIDAEKLCQVLWLAKRSVEQLRNDVSTLKIRKHALAMLEDYEEKNKQAEELQGELEREREAHAAIVQECKRQIDALNARMAASQNSVADTERDLIDLIQISSNQRSTALNILKKTGKPFDRESFTRIRERQESLQNEDIAINDYLEGWAINPLHREKDRIDTPSSIEAKIAQTTADLESWTRSNPLHPNVENFQYELKQLQERLPDCIAEQKAKRRRKTAIAAEISRLEQQLNSLTRPEQSRDFADILFDGIDPQSKA